MRDIAETTALEIDVTDETPDRPAEPTGSATAGHDAPTPAAFLLSALDSLEPDERQQVLRWLLENIPHAATAAFDLSPDLRTPAGGHRPPVHAREDLLLGLSDPSRGGFQVVPVRLPSGDHARLRAWSQDHGFSMATVIRGLLARFLDERQPGAPGTAQAG